jgi:hypothetical protein
MNSSYGRMDRDVVIYHKKSCMPPHQLLAWSWPFFFPLELMPGKDWLERKKRFTGSLRYFIST